MTLVVEDGSGVQSANSPVDVTESDDYLSGNGLSGWDASGVDKESALIRATSYIDARYTWKGRRAHGRLQGIAWPRIDVQDSEGEIIQDDEIPTEYKRAVMITAFIVTQGLLEFTTDTSTYVTSEALGPLRQTFAKLTTDDAGPDVLRFPDFVDGIVVGLTTSLGSMSNFLKRG